jgi:hypothetical protein
MTCWDSDPGESDRFSSRNSARNDHDFYSTHLHRHYFEGEREIVIGRGIDANFYHRHYAETRARSESDPRNLDNVLLSRDQMFIVYGARFTHLGGRVIWKGSVSVSRSNIF